MALNRWIEEVRNGCCDFGCAVDDADFDAAAGREVDLGRRLCGGQIAFCRLGAHVCNTVSVLM